jgi:drug/metabolite transporter (DMT)-like permease
VLLGLAAAFGGASVFGVAAVLQALAARREPLVRGVDPFLLVRLLRQLPFVAAVALNLSGFLLHVAALRLLPLFLAQAITASSVAITAVLSARVLRIRLTRVEVGAVGSVCVGLALLTATASSTGTAAPVDRVGHTLLAAAVVVAVAGVLVARLQGSVGAASLGLVAGLGFAVVAVAARVLPALDPTSLLQAPATYALVASGPLAFLLYATALQRAGVLTATAPSLLTQTVVPALVGVVVLGDELRDGALPLAAVGLLLAVTGILLLTRYDPHALVQLPQEGPGEQRPRPPERATGNPPAS